MLSTAPPLVYPLHNDRCGGDRVGAVGGAGKYNGAIGVTHAFFLGAMPLLATGRWYQKIPFMWKYIDLKIVYS